MKATTRFGFMCQPTPDRVAALEALPIDSLWVGGHIASPNQTPEAVVQLARLAALTSRVRVGTAVLLLPLYTPAIIAKQIADLDCATDGRVALGVGVGGEHPEDFRACGVPLGERGQRADEMIPLLRELWRAEPVDHVGTYYELRDVQIRPAPVRSGGPPIIVAGRRQAAKRRAALLGDGWMPYLYSAERYERSVSEIRDLAAQAGRDLAGFEWAAFVFVNVAADGRRAREEAADFLGATYRQSFEEFLGRVALAGTPGEVARGVSSFVRAGVQHFVFMPASRVRTAEITTLIAGEVMPLIAAT